VSGSNRCFFGQSIGENSCSSGDKGSKGPILDVFDDDDDLFFFPEECRDSVRECMSVTIVDLSVIDEKRVM